MMVVGSRRMEKKLQILVLDDSKETVDGLKNYLSQNYMVHTAYNGQDALKVFERKRQSLDLVITDVVMPDIGGGPRCLDNLMGAISSDSFGFFLVKHQAAS